MKKIIYLVRENNLHSPGVVKKVNQICNAFREKKYFVKLEVIKKETNAKELINKIYCLALENVNTIILRNDIVSLFIFFIPLVIQRLKGAFIIIDVPTPLKAVIFEIKMQREYSYFQKNIRILIIYFCYPWLFIIASKVIQYAPDSKYFSVGLNAKVEKVGNGIVVKDFSTSKSKVHINNELVLIGIGSLGAWHGYDRIIESLYNYERIRDLTQPLVKFIVIGEGEVKEDLQNQARQLGICNLVDFYGYKVGQDLDAIFDTAHIGVSSIATYRKGLNQLSDLKSREYFARGLPIIRAGYDIDFDCNLDYVFNVSNDNLLIDLRLILEWYKRISNYEVNIRAAIRSYAVKKLDYSVKIDKLLRGVVD
jgi:glycosyltransferase involved in cell wall biosynthesis